MVGRGLFFSCLCLWDQVGFDMARDANELLSQLHADLAEHLKGKLDDGSITTSELGILRQFLKDNQVTAQPVEGTPFGDLAQALPDIENVVTFRRKAG